MCIGTTRKRNLAQRLAALALGRRNRLLAQRERELERENTCRFQIITNIRDIHVFAFKV